MHIRESRLSNMDLKITAIMCVRGRDRGTFWYRSRDYSNHMGEGTWQRDFLVDLKITAIMWASGRDKLTFWYRFGIQQPCGWGDVGLSRHSYDCVLQCVAVRCVLRPCHILAPALVRLLGQECDMVLVHNTLQHTATHCNTLQHTWLDAFLTLLLYIGFEWEDVYTTMGWLQLVGSLKS